MIPRNPGTAYTGGDAFGSGPAFVLSKAQHKALALIAEEHAHTIKRGEEWTVRPSGIRAATVHALARMGALDFKVTSRRESDLRRGAFGRWIGGTKSWLEVTLWVKPTPERFAARVREARQADEVRARVKAQR